MSALQFYACIIHPPESLFSGISVLCIGLTCGAVSGATFVGYIYGSFLNPFIELAALFALPGYAHYHFRKNAGIDETERRVWLFGIAYFIASVIGHAFGARLLSIVPAVLFVSPLVLALLIDYELGPGELFADRQRLMVVAGGIGSVASYILAYFVTGFAFGPIIAILANSALLWVHFQVSFHL